MIGRERARRPLRNGLARSRPDHAGRRSQGERRCRRQGCRHGDTPAHERFHDPRMAPVGPGAL